jgi:hypothetical protein
MDRWVANRGKTRMLAMYFIERRSGRDEYPWSTIVVATRMPGRRVRGQFVGK